MHSATYCTCLHKQCSENKYIAIPIHTSVFDYVCPCAALAAWCSSVVEKTMFCRGVKLSAASEWLKFLQPGVTTDRSAKVRKSSQRHICTCMQMTDTTAEDTDGVRGSHHRWNEGKKTLKHNSLTHAASKWCQRVALAFPRREFVLIGGCVCSGKNPSSNWSPWLWSYETKHSIIQCLECNASVTCFGCMLSSRELW